MFSLTEKQKDDLTLYLRILADGCSDHPAYRAKRRPAVKGCIWCDAMYMARQLVNQLDESGGAAEDDNKVRSIADDLSSKGVERLKLWMRQHNIPQRSLAEKLGISQPTLSRYLKGDLKPTIDVVKKLDAATNGFMRASDW